MYRYRYVSREKLTPGWSVGVFSGHALHINMLCKRSRKVKGHFTCTYTSLFTLFRCHQLSSNNSVHWCDVYTHLVSFFHLISTKAEEGLPISDLSWSFMSLLFYVLTQNVNRKMQLKSICRL